jgi:cell division septal protein FtsQ
MPVTAPADKRFRRAHLKPTRKRSRWGSWRWRLSGLAVLLALLVAGGRWLATQVIELDMLQAQRIVVRGNYRLSDGEVRALLDGLLGESLLIADLDAWRDRLMSSPWVREASLRRVLPSTVEVAIEERTPLGIARIGSEVYLVDADGTVIDEYGPIYADLDLPIIDGIFSDGPLHDGLSSRSSSSPVADASRAALARRVLEAVGLTSVAANISQIDVTDARNAIVLLDGDPTLIRLGDGRFSERLQSYLELAPALRERVPDMDYVDLRFDQRVYVRPAIRQKVGTPASAGSGPGTSPARGREPKAG